MINVIVACDSCGGIGKDHGIPWSVVPADIRRFKQLTVDNVVVMGSGTWNSYGMKKPLPNRINVVITSHPDFCAGADQYITENIIESILDLEKQHPDKIIWIIGGGHVISQCIDIIDEWYITRFNMDMKCDVFIPKVWEDDKYQLVSVELCDHETVTIVPRYYSDLRFEVWKLI